MDLILSSKHLPVLSFHNDHQMYEGITLPHFLCLLLPPLLIRQLIRSVVRSGMIRSCLCEAEKQAPNLSGELKSVRIGDCLFPHLITQETSGHHYSPLLL